MLPRLSKRPFPCGKTPRPVRERKRVRYTLFRTCIKQNHAWKAVYGDCECAPCIVCKERIIHQSETLLRDCAHIIPHGFLNAEEDRFCFYRPPTCKYCNVHLMGWKQHALNELATKLPPDRVYDVAFACYRMYLMHFGHQEEDIRHTFRDFVLKRLHHADCPLKEHVMKLLFKEHKYYLKWRKQMAKNHCAQHMIELHQRYQKQHAALVQENQVHVTELECLIKHY